MKHNKKKKTLLSIGMTVLTFGMSALAAGDTLEGGIAIALGLACVVGYDYLDDKAKEDLIPEGVDAETLKELSETSADLIEELVEQRSKK